MSFSGKSFWMPRGAGCLTDGEINYDNPTRMESKRSQQWFMDGTGPELFGHKRQAIEAVNNRPVLGASHLNVSPWHNTSSFQSVSGQFSDRLFGPETMRTVNAVDRNVPSIAGGNMNVGRKDFNDPYGSNSSVCLSMSRGIEDTSRCLSFGGIRKVKVNQVRDTSNDISASMGHSYSRGNNNAISMEPTYKNDINSISLGPNGDNRDSSTISIGPTFSKADGNFISMGHTFGKGDGDFILMGHNYSKGNETILAMGPPFDKVDANFITMGSSYDKVESNPISMASSYGKGHEEFISMAPTYDKANENFISVAPSYSKVDNNTISIGPTFDKMDSNIASMSSALDTNAVSIGPTFDKMDSNITPVGSAQNKGDLRLLSTSHNYNKGDNNTISFGGFHEEPETDPDPSGGIISGYDLLTSNQNSAQTSEVPIQKDLVPSNADPVANNAQKGHPKTDMASKSKEVKTSKKAPPNNFPSNVKSLLSTGMLDGVPVKYVSWSREKNLKATIKGTGYLCGCKECNFSKPLNAYEFERHANCKTKHPNNHIYFENGKTIYSVVQELKNSPQEMLFDLIQNVTGSQINQKNFRIWKASYQAATRELQRIYGKDEVVVPP